VWKSFQTNQLLSHQAVETPSFWVEIAHPQYPGAAKSLVIVFRLNSLLPNHYELEDRVNLP